VVRGREPRLGEERVVPAPEAREAMDRAVAGLAAGQGGDQMHVLADHGIQYVLYPRPEMSGPADATMVDTLDGTPGLGRQSLSQHYALWEVGIPTGALRVVSEDGTGSEPLEVSGSGDERTAVVAEGNTGRRLALAETAGSGWHATLDGVELSPVAAEGGTQAWALPVDGGELRVWHTDHVHVAWLVTQGLLLLAVSVLAAPGVRTEEETRLIETTPAPRPRRPERLRRTSRRRSRARRGASVPGAVRTPADAGDADGSGASAREAAPEDAVEDGPEPGDGGPATGAVPVASGRGHRRGSRGTRRKEPGRRRAGGRPGTDDGGAGASGTERGE